MENKLNFSKEDIKFEELVVYILLKWKIILLFCIISAILGCIFVVFKGNEHNANSKLADFDNSDDELIFDNFNDDLIKNYLIEKDLNSNEISNIYNALEKEKIYREVYASNLEYLNNSEFMKADRLNVLEIKFTVNCEDRLLKRNILEGYSASLKSNNFSEHIVKSTNQNLDLKYMNEMINVYLNDTLDEFNTNYYVTLSISSSDKGLVEDMQKNAIDWIVNKNESIKEEYGEYEVIIVGKSVNSLVNTKYLDTKTDFYNKLENTSDQIRSIANNLSDTERFYFEKISYDIYNDNLVKAENDMPVKSVSFNYLKNFILYATIGILIGFLLAIIIIYLNIIFRDLLRNDKELLNNYNLDILGGIVCEEIPGKNPIDKLLLDIRYKSNLFVNIDNKINVLHNSIKLNSNKKNIKNILLIGQMSSEVSRQLALVRQLLEKDGIMLELGSTIENDYSLLNEYDGVILLETIDKSTNFKIKKELYLLKMLDVNIIGTIVVY